MAKKHNPNYHKRVRQDTSNSWSDLPLDLSSLVSERLSVGDFRRAKSVCSSRYSASRQSVSKNQTHWLILFPKYNKNNNNNNYSCTLFNPEKKDKLYKTQDLGVDIAKNVCIATYGSWLLMRDPLYNIYIVNLLTCERINLPPVESLWKDYELGIPSPSLRKYKGMSVIRSPVFWIDKKTKHYVVLWGLRDLCVVYSKKGDNLWNKIPDTSDCLHMVYKDHKLYLLSLSLKGSFRIFDFSGEIPEQTFQCGVFVERFQLGKFIRKSRRIVATTLVVTVTGEVLKVEKWWRPSDKTWFFRVFKVYSSELKKERIDSLGDESMLLDQGITVLANDTDHGFIRNSIYFSVSQEKNTNDIFIFNLETQKTERLHTFDPSSVEFSTAQWFLPSFTHT